MMLPAGSGWIILVIIVVLIGAAIVGKLDKALGCAGQLGPLIVTVIVIIFMVGLLRECEEEEQFKIERQKQSEEYSRYKRDLNMRVEKSLEEDRIKRQQREDSLRNARK